MCYHISATPLLVDMDDCWLTAQLYHTSEELFCFVTKNIPYLCGVLSFRKRLSTIHNERRRTYKNITSAIKGRYNLRVRAVR